MGPNYTCIACDDTTPVVDEILCIIIISELSMHCNGVALQSVEEEILGISVML